MGEEALKSGTIRRSVTIRPELNRRLRDFMAASTRNGIDIDYTQALNLFAELGAKWLEESDKQTRQRVRDVFSRYVDPEKLEESEVLAYFREFEEFRRWKLVKSKAQLQTA